MKQAEDREKIEIFISCRSLVHHQEIQRGGAQIIMKLKDERVQFREVCRTETIKGSQNPNFSKSYVMDFIFEVNQPVCFVLSENQGQELGECVTSIGQIVGAKNSTVILPLMGQENIQKVGIIILRAEKVATDNEDEVSINIQCNHIEDTKLMSKASPFLVISRITENKDPLKIYQSEFIKHNQNPIFQTIKLKIQKLCNGDYNLPIQVECWDYDQSGKHTFIGKAHFSLNHFLKQKITKFVLMSAKNKDSGQMVITDININHKVSFLDYVRGGIHLNLICAIDFTGSNGVPSRPDSLHGIQNEKILNSYQQAIKSVGEILLEYDEDKLIPLYGFGAKPKLPHFSSLQTLHCFPLNGKQDDHNVDGIKGIMDTYKTFLNYVELSGPTLFNPLLMQAKKIAEQSKQQGSENYYIFLILTDGEIHDMEPTLASIVELSILPLSIIIIGIGDADFSQMVILDGDEGLYDLQGNLAKRDIVQFVPFNEYKHDPAFLASKVLEELPEQIVSYYQLIKKQPIQPVYQRMQSVQAIVHSQNI